jgi:hypothetical protein
MKFKELVEETIGELENGIANAKQILKVLEAKKAVVGSKLMPKDKEPEDPEGKLDDIIEGIRNETDIKRIEKKIKDTLYSLAGFEDCLAGFKAIKFV